MTPVVLHANEDVVAHQRVSPTTPDKLPAVEQFPPDSTPYTSIDPNILSTSRTDHIKDNFRPLALTRATLEDADASFRWTTFATQMEEASKDHRTAQQNVRTAIDELTNAKAEDYTSLSATVCRSTALLQSTADNLTQLSASADRLYSMSARHENIVPLDLHLDPSMHLTWKDRFPISSRHLHRLHEHELVDHAVMRANVTRAQMLAQEWTTMQRHQFENGYTCIEPYTSDDVSLAFAHEDASERLSAKLTQLRVSCRPRKNGDSKRQLEPRELEHLLKKLRDLDEDFYEPPEDDSVVRMSELTQVTLGHDTCGVKDSSKPSPSAMAYGGANIILTAFEELLDEVETIAPIPLGVAVSGTPQFITRRGYLPITLDDGQVIRVTAFVHPSASDTILSPEAILHSHEDFYQWEQQGSKGDDNWLRFYSWDNRLLLSMALTCKNRLYYYDLTHVVLKSTVCKLETKDLACFQVNETTIDTDSPVRRQQSRKTPTTLPQQLDAELWSGRMEFPGEDGMVELPKHAEGLPSHFNFHPLRFIDHKEAAMIQKQAANRTAERTPLNGQRLFMDFGFMQSSTDDFMQPNPAKDRVVDSFDGYSSYLLVKDEASQKLWLFLTKSKEPPIEYASEFLHANGLTTGGVIRCDQGGELARSEKICSVMFSRHHYKVEPTGADSPSQNGSVEKMNHILAVIVRTLLYGSELEAKYWSVALVHAVYLYNRRVHRALKRTPHEAWYGRKPNLKSLRMFGSRVCVKRTGKRRAKLDRHDFQGIFLGYSATDNNIRYVDLTSNTVKTCRHAVFDEAWYLQPTRPPAAQLLYDLGLCSEQDYVDPSAIQPLPVALYPPMALTKKIADTPIERMTHLPLQVSQQRPSAAAAALTKSFTNDDPYKGTVLDRHLSTAPPVVDEYGISKRDLAQIYVSPHPYNQAFEEILELRRFNATKHSTAGLCLDEVDGRLILQEMAPGTPGHKIVRW